MVKNIKINGKEIGLNAPVFISAEVGTTCNGDLETAKKLIDAAKYAGMDAVKFQIIGPEEIHSDHSVLYKYKTFKGEEKIENLVQMLKKYKFSLDEWREIKEYADIKGIIMFATVDYPAGIEIAEDLNFPVYKICSWDLNYYPFIKKIAKLNKPIIFDTGPVGIAGLSKVANICKKEGNEKIAFLHCYHTNDYREINMKTIKYVRDTLGVLSGLSSADRNFDIDFMAMAFKPAIIEKRMTLDKANGEHHHAIALEPEEMKKYIEKIRKIEQAIGEYGIFPSKGDLEDKKKYWRRIVANCDMQKGEILTEKNIECKRPLEGGVDPLYYDFILGRTLKKDIKKNEPITKDII